MVREMKALSLLLDFIKNLVPGSKTKLNRSQLVGMYLLDANKREKRAIEAGDSRQRRNGRFSYNRERF